MPSTDQFFFSVLRVSIIQIIRAAGFERCNNSCIDTLTDLYIRYLLLISSECLKLANGSDRQDLKIQDIAQALINVRLIKPSKMIDPYDVGVENYLGMRNFVQWIKSEEFAKTKRVADPSKEAVELTLRNNTEGEPVEAEQEISEMDWLNYVLRTQSKMDYEEKINSTVLNPKEWNGTFQDEDFSDYNIMGPTPKHLIDVLPCRKKLLLQVKNG